MQIAKQPLTVLFYHIKGNKKCAFTYNSLQFPAEMNTNDGKTQQFFFVFT